MNLPKTCRQCNWQLPALALACPMCRFAVKGRLRVIGVYLGIMVGIASVGAILVLVATF